MAGGLLNAVTNASFRREVQSRMGDRFAPPSRTFRLISGVLEADIERTKIGQSSSALRAERPLGSSAPALVPIDAITTIYALHEAAVARTTLRPV